MKKIIIADDSKVIKKLVSASLPKDNFNVIETAENGMEAFQKTMALRPDAVIMDLNMPICNGLESTELIMKNCPTPVIVLTSSEEKENFQKVLKAGALSVISKPKGFDYKKVVSDLVRDLTNYSNNRSDKKDIFVINNKKFSLDEFKPEILCIGASTGGPNAIINVLKKLGKVNIPIVIVQHITDGYGLELAKWVSNHTEMKVKVATTKPEAILAGTIYFPDNASQLLIKNNKTILSTKEKLHSFICPSIDVTFESAVSAYFSNVIGVLLTGMGKDGVSGMEKIYFYNGYTIAQSKEDCVVFGMPKAAIEKQVVRETLHIEEIGTHIRKLLDKNKV